MAISSGNDPIVGINITPLVDVCLVLVIIFMVAAPMFVQSNLPVELPKAHTVEGKEGDNVTITITIDGKWALNEDEMDPSGMVPKLKAKLDETNDRAVIIRADRQAPYAYVLEALRMAKAAGGETYSIATEQKERSGEAAKK